MNTRGSHQTYDDASVALRPRNPTPMRCTDPQLSKSMSVYIILQVRLCSAKPIARLHRRNSQHRAVQHVSRDTEQLVHSSAHRCDCDAVVIRMSTRNRLYALQFALTDMMSCLLSEHVLHESSRRTWTCSTRVRVPFCST